MRTSKSPTSLQGKVERHAMLPTRKVIFLQARLAGQEPEALVGKKPSSQAQLISQ